MERQCVSKASRQLFLFVRFKSAKVAAKVGVAKLTPTAFLNITHKSELLIRSGVRLKLRD
jgi:hypothetical protein